MAHYHEERDCRGAAHTDRSGTSFALVSHCGARAGIFDDLCSPLWAGDGKRAQATHQDVRFRGALDGRHHGDFTREQREGGLSRSLVGNVQDIDACCRAQLLACKMNAVPLPAEPKVSFPG